MVAFDFFPTSSKAKIFLCRRPHLLEGATVATEPRHQSGDADLMVLAPYAMHAAFTTPSSLERWPSTKMLRFPVPISVPRIRKHIRLCKSLLHILQFPRSDCYEFPKFKTTDDRMPFTSLSRSSHAALIPFSDVLSLLGDYRGF